MTQRKLATSERLLYMDFKLLNTRMTMSLELDGSRNSALQLSI